ncbi:hypothetical protein LMCDFJHI_00005 [Aeromonas salmonicida]
MKKWIGFAALLFAAITQASQELGKLHYLSEEYKPYNYTDSAGTPTGLAVELLHQVWKRPIRRRKPSPSCPGLAAITC